MRGDPPHLHQLVLQFLQAGLGPHQILLDPQILARERIVVKGPFGILLKRLQIEIQLLARLPKRLAPVAPVDLQERSPFPRSRLPVVQHLVVRRRVHDHRGVFAERLLGLLEDGFREDADVDAGVAGGGDHGPARDGGHPDVGAKGGGGGEEFGGGEVGEVVRVVADVKKGRLGGEFGVVLFDLEVDLGFEVEVLDYGAFWLLG